jgi:hypothetical protein
LFTEQERIATALRFEDEITVPFEDGTNERPDGLFVFDE